MRRFVNPGKRIASFTRTFARLRWALNFDGIGVRGQLANRAINPDGDNSFEFWTGNAPNTTVVAQNISILASQREFQIYLSGGVSIDMIYGGTTSVLLLESEGAQYGAKYFLNLVGTTYTIAKGTKSNIVKTGTFIKGPAREPAAITHIGARSADAGQYGALFRGIQRDIRINGKLYPMRNYDQRIQLPFPTGLGTELITPTVLENPYTKGTQWTYLGNGRWQYIGDGTLNDLTFIATVNQPVAGFVEFEVESISGTMVCSAGSLANSAFTSAGLFRYFYLSNSAANLFQFKRNTAGSIASCIVKNISFKPLGTCNPMTISNATSANWMQVVDDYDPKFRKVLRFDSVGTRGLFLNTYSLSDEHPIKVKVITGNTLASIGCLFGPDLGANYNSRIIIYGDGSVKVRATVSSADVITLPVGTIAPNTKYEFELYKSGITYTLYINGQIAGSGSNASATASLIAQVGATASGTTGIPTGLFNGVIYDLEIGGVKYPIADSNQTIQLPEPSGLGAELITQTVLENPAVKGTQWTYLGDGRWQYIGDGTDNELRFIPTPNQPEQGYIEFEIESITGSIRCTNNSVTGSIFTTTGVKRFFYTSLASVGVISFKRTNAGVAVSCIIKNISFKPLGTCNPLTLANVTSANWEDLEI